jgi:hypothetical protein
VGDGPGLEPSDLGLTVADPRRQVSLTPTETDSHFAGDAPDRPSKRFRGIGNTHVGRGLHEPAAPALHPHLTGASSTVVGGAIRDTPQIGRVPS